MAQWAIAALCVLVLGGPGIVAAGAQEQQLAPAEQITTLHVYTNLVQVPVLVLGSNYEPVPPIAPGRFSISIDGGAKFRVTQSRPEGDDPINLTILLDLSQPDTSMMDRIDDAIAGLASGPLTAKDHVSLYVLDCKLFRPSVETPIDPAMLKKAVDTLLAPWRQRGEKVEHAGCMYPRYLWDTLAGLSLTREEHPGRQVILAVTDGVDRGSTNTWNSLNVQAQDHGVAIFGLAQQSDSIPSYFPSPPSGRGSQNVGLQNMGLQKVSLGNSDFSSVCQLSGGVLLGIDSLTVRQQLEKVVKLVRNRYIIEFPKPRSSEGGRHTMNISVEKGGSYLIRPAGVSMPSDDAKRLNDPTTVHSDTDDGPEIGKRKASAPN